jgi:branched-chain amino acid transport system substrate-binding protein
LLLAAAIALSSCIGPGGNSQQLLGVLKLGADLPLSGDDARDGTPVEHAIDLALSQAGLICGAVSHRDACVQLKAVVADDVNKGIHDPAKGAKNVETLAADAAVMAVIGPLYDSMAKSELPVANPVHLAIVSPAVTDACLTQEPPDGHCHGLAARLRPGGGNAFFRVVTTQLVEATAAADLAFSQLGKRSAFIVNDQTAIGQSLAIAFSDRFTQDGGTVVDPSDLGAFDPNQAPDFNARIDRARELAADLIYFAGSEIGAAAALRRDMVARGLPVPLIGPDSLASGQFARLAGDSAHGSYYTVVGPHPATLRSAATFLRAYQRAYAQAAGAVSLAAFDATNIVIRAIARAIDDAGGKIPTRGQALAEIRRTSDDSGAMGVMSFDARGDTTLKLISAYQWLASTQPAGDFVAQLTVH